jgi:heme/copper-type cytochrome/quinol oxidase subunit 2
LVYDSYQLVDNSLNEGDYRNKEVDYPLILNLMEPTRLILTSADTIHSFFLIDFGVKVDCVPGRLNQVLILPLEPGVFFGYCAELCGVKHSFMPITVEVVYPTQTKNLV